MLHGSHIFVKKIQKFCPRKKLDILRVTPSRRCFPQQQLPQARNPLWKEVKNYESGVSACSRSLSFSDSKWTCFMSIVWHEIFLRHMELLIVPIHTIQIKEMVHLISRFVVLMSFTG